MYYWAIKKMETLLTFVTAIGMLLFLLGQTANSQEKGIKPTVRIELLGERTKTLSSPLRIKGKFKTENFAISYLPIEKIESLAFAEKQQDEKMFLLKLHGTDKAIRGYFSGDAELTGLGEWGKETVAMNIIKSMQMTNVGDIKPFKPESRWQCTFKSDEQLAIGWTSKWSSDREFLGHIGDGSLNLAVQQVAKLIRNGDLWTVISNDGLSIEGWQPKKKSLSVSSPFGGLELSWSKVAKLSNESATAGDLKQKTKRSHPTDWRVEIGEKFVLPVRELQTGTKAMINDELNIKSLNWQFVDSTSPKPAGLQLNFSNKKSWMLQGTITGNSSVGKVEASIEHITKLVRLTPSPKNQVPSEYNKRIVGRIITNNGTEYPVAEPSLVGGSRAQNNKNYWGYELYVITATPVELWVESALILSHTLFNKDKKLLSNNPLLKQYGPLEGFTGIAFVNPVGNFTLPVTKLIKYLPQTQKATSDKISPANYRITVRDAKENEFTTKITTIQFIRYPKTGWTGSYTRSAYPFQWHRASELFFKKDSGERMNVHFNKLSKIEIIGRYNSNRHAILTSTKGSLIEGSIYPGDVAKSHGVATWNPHAEGLLCQTINGMYFFVRFNDVNTIKMDLMASN